MKWTYCIKIRVFCSKASVQYKIWQQLISNKKVLNSKGSSSDSCGTPEILKKLYILIREYYQCLWFLFIRLATYLHFYVGIVYFQIQMFQPKSQKNLNCHYHTLAQTLKPNLKHESRNNNDTIMRLANFSEMPTQI